MFDHPRIGAIIAAFKNDPESVYNTWFINNDTRLKAFGAIRRGVEQVVAEIQRGTFPNDFKGSSLETVLTAITEQKQVFEGAAHAFYWKPKLRIPDIYESEPNKAAFGQFLESCLNASNESQVLEEIARLASIGIKGLGPAVANILYFLHPTMMPPCNTAIVRGANFLFVTKSKLGSWQSYLEMRDTMLCMNSEFRNLLSKDFGAVAGLLFDIGVGKTLIDSNLSLVDGREQERRARLLKKRHDQVEREVEEENQHSEMQFHLLTIGRALGYDVVVAMNDRAKSYADQKFSFLSLPELPEMAVDPAVHKTIGLIDVIWLERGTGEVVCAYEVEKTTSIYSGILRLMDLALALPDPGRTRLYLVAPDAREKEVVAQLKRPSIATQASVTLSYILFSELSDHCDSICKLGSDYRIMEKIAKCP